MFTSWAFKWRNMRCCKTADSASDGVVRQNKHANHARLPTCSTTMGATRGTPAPARCDRAGKLLAAGPSHTT